MNSKLSFKVFRYPKGVDETFLYRRGVGFFVRPLSSGNHIHVSSAPVDERGGIVELSVVLGFAFITVGAVCARRDVFRYKDGGSLCGHTLCLARMQAITDRLGITNQIDWPSGWPVKHDYLKFLLDWRLYEETQRELKKEAAEERRRQDDINFAEVRAEARWKAQVKARLENTKLRAEEAMRT